MANLLIIKDLLKEKKMSLRDLAATVGITEQGLQKLIRENSTKVDTLEAIANALDVSPGRFFSHVDTTPVESTQYVVNQRRQGVPYYDVDFINGFDLVLNDQSVNPAYHIDFPQYNNADCWVNATGDSMKPLINHGDIVALRHIEDWQTYMLFGEIYAVVTSEYRTIKRVRKSTKGDEYLRFVPFNTAEFDEQDVPIATIQSVSQVIGCAKKIF
ncbi:helix-turn-helix domain-containing protein [Alistipes sp. OttesenSCG-928-L06]|nr:helix-turn-helix domain-containing protein [Alistipes sp. OttesenSCG-928-L06]